MRSSLLQLLSWCAVCTTPLAGAELPAPTLDLHPDGGRVTWTVAVPADGLVIDLPAWCSTPVTVSGCDWSEESVTTEQQVPAAAPALLAERQELQRRLAHLTARRAVLAANETLLRQRLPRLAASGAPTAAWQESLDDLLSRLAAVESEEAGVRQSISALRIRAGALANHLALEQSGPLTVEALADSWTQETGKVTLRRLHLSAGSQACIQTERSDVWWRPTASLHLGQPTTIQPRAAVTCPIPLGTVTVRALGRSLAGRLEGPAMRSTVITAEEVTSALRRQFTGGERSVAWKLVTTTADMPAAASTTPSITTQSGEDVARTLPAAPGDHDIGGTGAFTAIGAGGGSAGMFGSRSGGGKKRALSKNGGTAGTNVIASVDSNLSYDLGQITCDGSETQTLSLDSQPVTVIADEWAVFPTDQPVAIRRVSVRLDTLALPAGWLTVLGSTGARSGPAPAIPAGGILTVCAGMDETISVSKIAAWEVDAATNTDQYRREGTDHWLVNASDAPRTIAVYRTIPVSTSDELTVTRDPDSTPDARELAPGLLRWQVTLPPGTPVRLGLGWQLQAHGSFRF